MKKYAILIIVLVSAFSTLSATFDTFSPEQQAPQITIEQEGNDSFFKHDGLGCTYGQEV